MDSGLFHFLIIINNAAIIIPEQDFVWTYVFNSLGYTLTSEIAGFYNNSMF